MPARPLKISGSELLVDAHHRVRKNVGTACDGAFASRQQCPQDQGIVAGQHGERFIAPACFLDILQDIVKVTAGILCAHNVCHLRQLLHCAGAKALPVRAGMLYSRIGISTAFATVS